LGKSVAHLGSVNTTALVVVSKVLKRVSHIEWSSSEAVEDGRRFRSKPEVFGREHSTGGLSNLSACRLGPNLTTDSDLRSIIMGIEAAEVLAKSVGNSLSLAGKVPDQCPRTDQSSPWVCGVNGWVERLLPFVRALFEELSIGDVVTVVTTDSGTNSK
jgi:hypothetical protein